MPKKKRNMQRKTELDASFNMDVAQAIFDAYEEGDEDKFRRLCKLHTDAGGEVIFDEDGQLRIFSSWQSFGNLENL